MKKKVVVIGGGTGTYSVLSGLKKYGNQVDVTAIVAMTDSGSSTGRLRDELGALPVGDVRMALLALGDESRIDNHTLRELFLYRFQKGGEGLRGHNFGNLLLVALSEVMGSELSAIEVVSRMFNIHGCVLPVSTESLTLVAQYEDGSEVVGEKDIDVPPDGWVEKSISNIEVRPRGVLTPGVREALLNADVIILGPGDLYTSLLAAVLVGEMRELIQKSPAQFIYIGNLMSKWGQTTGYNSATYIKEIEKYTGRAPGTMFINTTSFPPDALTRYTAIGEHPVEDTGSDNTSTVVIRGDFVATEEVTRATGDTYKRSLIRHDAEKLSSALMAYFDTLTDV